jgi:hypothetical protein
VPETTIDITALIADPNAVPPEEGLGHAAVGFDGTDYWVAKWASATISRISTAGVLVDTFEIAGLTGTRSFTADGTYLYAGNTTSTIYRIDPSTRTLAPPHITVSGFVTARYASYDPTADSGNGGFWIGNFNTDIVLIDRSGNALTTIPAAGLPGGRYGVAFDNATAAGPILWMFYQGGLTGQCELGAIDLPSGAVRPSTQSMDFPALGLTNCLAGGTFLASGSGLRGGGRSLLTLLQGTPANFLLGFDPAPTFPVELQSFSVE